MRPKSTTNHGQYRQAGAESSEWLPARVPGDVHTDLLAAGRIPDPFVADNEKRVQWVAATDWEYRLKFDADPDLLGEQQVFLVADGLDTLAEVTLNGARLGETDNMFRQYRWDVKSLLRESENTLHILFHSPVQYVEPLQAQRPLRGVSQAIPGGPYLRKAPCQFGWDWGPQLPPIGIWKDMWLEGRSVARLANVHLRQYHRDGGVTLEATVTAARWQEVDLTAQLTVTAPDGQVLEVREVIDGHTAAPQVLVVQPELWWPNGYGDQPLYQVEIQLLADERAHDRVAYAVGLRTIQLLQEPDNWGQSFTFVVNGVPLFAKGSNWIPADSFPTRLTDAHLERLISDAAATHHNMLRVWGGGFYEEERFYDLCDRYGILVWQDLVFSCSIYPLGDEAFVENVQREALDNIRRLRHRASLALWCGNNEMEWGWVEWGWDVPQNADLKADYDRFFHQTLPEWCVVEDPDTPYWPSSPSSGVPFDGPNSETVGDAHYWQVWHGGRPFTAYRTQYPRFMSEFGFQSLPPMETVRAYADQADWNMTSYIMEHHQRSAGGNGKMVAHMTDHYRMPKDFPALVYLSQVLQAEGIRYGVEHWRRNRHRVSGTLYWQLNDCWPVASWSSLDYFGRWKALHYAARRFYAPVLLSLEDSGAAVGVHVTSDLTQRWSGEVRWSLETLRGDVLENGKQPVSLPALASTRIYALDFSDRISDANRRNLVLVCELVHEHQRRALTVATFVPDKHLALADPDIKATARLEADVLALALKSSCLARFVEVGLANADVVFSDNYFDLPAGRTVTVTCALPDGWSLERASKSLQVRSLHDSYG